MRPGFVLLSAIAATVLLSACEDAGSGSDPSAVSVDGDSGHFVYDFGLCDGDPVHWVELGEANRSDTVLWRIEADDPQPLATVAVGDLPPGFAEAVPLSTTTWDALVLSVGFGDDGSRSHSQQFSQRELEPGVYLRDHERLSSRELDDDRDERCDDDLLMDVTVPSSVDGVAAVVLITGVIAIAALAWRRGREEKLSAG